MRNLLLLFLRYGGVVVFLFLEIICFYLIVQFNEPQQSIYFNSINRVSTTLEDRFSKLNSFFYLQQVNDSLAVENARLRAALPRLRYNPYAIADTTQIKRDSTLQMYSFIPVGIVQNSTTRRRNYIIIDKGSEHGIKPHMGLLTSSGVAGVVRSVEPHFSLVMSMLNTQARISSEIQASGYHGTLIWGGNDPRVMELKNIPKHASVAKGDTVLTSGFSNLFPPSIPIGIIREFEIPGGSNYYEIEVDVFADLSSLRTAYVVVHKWSEELERLEESIIDDE